MTFQNIKVQVVHKSLKLDRIVRFGHKMGHIGTKCEKYCIFKIKFQYILALQAEIYLIFKNPGIVPFGDSDSLALFWDQI